MEDDSILRSQSDELSYVESAPTPSENQHLAQNIPSDRIHFSVDISQTVAATPPRERDIESWEGTHP
jgi:hypothetical protein